MAGILELTKSLEGHAEKGVNGRSLVLRVGVRGFAAML
jgi:hypothetical protein